MTQSRRADARRQRLGDAMDAIDAIHRRRSIRHYQQQSVPRGLIEAILLDAAQAPTSPVSRNDPFRFLVIEGSERIASYGARALEYARHHRPSGPAFDWIDKPDFSVFFNAPTVIVIVAKDDGLGQAVQDCNRAGQNLMLSAHARGLGTCWVGSPMLWLRDPATLAELGVPDGYGPYAAFTLGYPAAVPAPQARAAPPIIWSR